MKHIVLALLAILSLYSVALIGIELSTSQDYVHNFFSDIDGPVPFFAVNTTLSVFFLWSTALVFAICVVCTQGLPKMDRLRWFFLSQIFVFAWLGFDDRFKFHEFAARKLDIGDHYILLAVAIVELCLLVFLGGREILRRPHLYSLGAASVLFVIMTFFDACVPNDMVLRPTLEDLAKTWANLCFLAFAWQLFSARVDELKEARIRELARGPTN